MRILFFIDVFSRGGKERRLTELMKILKSSPDFDFELAVMNEDIQFEEIYSLDIRIHFLTRKTKKDLSVIPRLYRICRNFNPDIIHCWDSMTAVYCMPVCKFLGIKLVNGMVTNAPSSDQAVYQKTLLRARITFPFSDVIVGNSRAGLKSYNAPAGKSNIIYNGFNFERLENLADPASIRDQLNIKTKHIVGMVATFSEKKDYRTYFGAAQIILTLRNDVTFLAIGQDTDSEISRSYIKQENHGFFRLLGSKTGIESYINAMDICVLSTFTEGISNSILEYMALMKPVVASSGGGTNEIIEDGKTGFLVRQSDSNELAEKINILLSNEQLRIKMGLAGKTSVQNNFSIEKMVSSYITLYKNLINKRVSGNEDDN